MDSPDDAARLDELGVGLDRARDELNAGRPDDAREALVAVFDDLDRLRPGHEVSRQRARALRLLAMVEFETDGSEPALARLDQAHQIASSIEDDELVALAWSSRATVLERSGVIRDALSALDEAVARLPALIPRDRAIVSMRRGLARGHTGDLDGGVADLAAAAELASQHRLGALRFMALHNLGYLRHLQGDVPAALRAMDEADRLEVDVSRGIAMLDRGRVLLEAGLVDEAHDTLGEAAAVCRGDGQRQAEAEALYEQGRAAVLMGRAADALGLLRRAADRFDRRTSAAWVLHCRLAELRIQLEAHHLATPGEGGVPREPSGTVAATARDLAGRADVAGDTIARRAAVLAAEAAALAGDGDGAAALLPDDDPATVPLITARLDDHRARATVALARGDHAAARRVLGRAAADLERAAASASTFDLRTARQIHATVLARMDLALAVQQGPVAVLSAIDRWRASSARLPPVRPHASPTIAALLADRRRIREGLRDEPDDTASWDELARIEARIATESRTARPTTNGRDRGSADPETTAPVSFATLVDALAVDRRDLLVTAQHGRDIVAVTVVNGTPTIHTVGPVAPIAEGARRLRADLRMVATRQLGPLADAVSASLRAGAADLASALLGTASSSERRLLVVAHGDLIGLPWGLLAPGRPVTLAASSSGWVHARRRASHARQAAGPRVGIVRGPRLIAADEESARVAAAWGVAPPAGTATAATLVETVRSASIVHVVAHGRHNRQQPLFSSLDLGDGPCSLYDLETGGVGAEQVVLAACNAGRATIRPGDEPLGLAAGLLALGARTVVAPVAPVPDELLPDVMGRLHEGLAAGAPADQALVDATRDAPIAARAFVVSGVATSQAQPHTEGDLDAGDRVADRDLA